MILDGYDINCSLTNKGENIIECEYIEEIFFDLFNIQVNDSVQLVKKAERYSSNRPIITTDIRIGNKLYEGVEFKLVKGKKGAVFVNQNTLYSGKLVEEEGDSEDEQTLFLEEALRDPPVEQEVLVDNELLEKTRKESILYRENIIKKALNEVKEQLEDRHKQQLEEKIQSLVSETLRIHDNLIKSSNNEREAFKQEINTTLNEWQKSLSLEVSNKIDKLVIDAQNILIKNQDEAITDKFKEINESVSIITDNHGLKITEFLNEKLEKAIDEKWTALTKKAGSINDVVKKQSNEIFKDLKQKIISEQKQSFDKHTVEIAKKQQQWFEETIETRLGEASKKIDESIEYHTVKVEDILSSKATALEKIVEERVDSALQTITKQAEDNHNKQLGLVEENVAKLLHISDDTDSKIDVVEEKSKNIVQQALKTYKGQITNEIKNQLTQIQHDIYRKFAIYVGSFGGGGGGSYSPTTIIQSGGSAQSSFTITQTTPTLQLNDAVYVAADETFVPAIATTPLSADVIGIVTGKSGNDYTITVNGLFVPPYSLEPGFIYFLSDTVAGSATLVEPVQVGYVSKPLFTAINSVSAVFTNMRGIVVG